MNNVALNEITATVLALPLDERALLADKLVESLDPSTDDSISDLWVAEALRRLGEVRSGKVETIDGPTGFDQVRRAIKK